MNIVLQGVLVVVIATMTVIGASSLLETLFSIRRAKLEEKELSKKTLVELKRAQEGILSELREIKTIFRVNEKWKK